MEGANCRSRYPTTAIGEETGSVDTTLPPALATDAMRNGDGLRPLRKKNDGSRNTTGALPKTKSLLRMTKTSGVRTSQPAQVEDSRAPAQHHNAELRKPSTSQWRALVLSLAPEQMWAVRQRRARRAKPLECREQSRPRQYVTP